MGTIFSVLESSGAVNITGPVNVNNNPIHNVSDPSSAQDVATMNYVNNVAVAGVSWKEPVKYATTTTLPTYTYSNGSSGVGATITEVGFGVLTIDGVTPSVNDRVLIKNETAGNAPYNGIYTVTVVGSVSASFVLTRAVDYDTNTEIVAGDVVAAAAGNTLADTIWIQTTVVSTVGTDNITFSQFSRSFPLSVSNGGTGLTTLTAHNILLGEGTSNVAFAAPTSTTGVALISNGSSSDPSFGAINVASSSAVTGTLAIANGGTNSASTLTNGKLMVSSGGAVVEGTSSSTPTFTSETLTATTNQLVLGTTNTVTISSTAPSASRTYTLPDAGAAANFVLDQGNYTIGGTWTFSNAVTITATTNQLVLSGPTRTATITAPQPATASRTYTFPDLSGNYNVVGDSGTQTIGGSKTFSSALTINPTTNQLVLGGSSGNTNTISSTAPATANRTWTIPDISGNATFVALEGTQTFSGAKTFSAGTGAITMSSSTIAMGSNKITGLANGTASSDAAAFGQIYYGFQAPVQTRIASSFSTTSNTFQNVGLDATITPTSSSHRIKISVCGGGGTGAVLGAEALFTLIRNSTELSSSGGGFALILSQAAQTSRDPFSIVFIDSPATTSSTTYHLALRNNDNTNTVTLSGAVDAVIILEEIV